MSKFKKFNLTPEHLDKIPEEVQPEPIEKDKAKKTEEKPENDVPQGEEETTDEDMQISPESDSMRDTGTADSGGGNIPDDGLEDGGDVTGIDFNEWYFPQGEPSWINY